MNCSVCKSKADKEILVIWKGQKKYVPRCGEHIVKGYQGEIRKIRI